MSEKQPPLIMIVISILAIMGWLIFILLFTLFWSTDFTLFQNIVIIIVSLLFVVLLISLMWVVWASRSRLLTSTRKD